TLSRAAEEAGTHRGYPTPARRARMRARRPDLREDRLNNSSRPTAGEERRGQTPYEQRPNEESIVAAMGALRSRAAPGFLPLLLLAVLMGSRVSAKNGVDLFVSSTLRTWANMSRMVVDKDTGKVYVGGANRIYQLTPNLETESLAFMGPYRDSSHCSPTSGCLPGQEKLRDYHTKAMAIDYLTKSLVVCGNVIRGSCTLHSLQNPISITDLFCGLDVNTPLEGSKPITAKSALSYTDTLLTSVVATPIYNFTAVFLGTNRGHLKKVLLESATSGYQVDDIAVDEGNPLLRDMLFDGSKERIYVMTDYMLSAVDVQQCFRYLKCGVCTSNRDPYCGWCGPEKK
ncbi:hypothetical protein HPB47_012089, partial [Ixodes persulcatus]